MSNLVLKKVLFICFFLVTNAVLAQHSKINMVKFQSYDDYPVYLKGDLGVTYCSNKTIVKLWSPNVEETKINLYKKGDGGVPTTTENLLYDPKTGVWQIVLNGDYHNTYYTLQVKNNGNWSKEMPDPYAKGVGVNGNKGLIFDATKTNPLQWHSDKKPLLKSFSDIIIYEAHVRDLSIDASSGIKNKGKFLGLTETNTKNDFGQSTGLDHLKEMGITHLHLLPIFDFRTIDETKLDQPQYNWGYDPKNYNAPEGSYSTNPFDGLVRIKEYKQMVQSLHESGIRLVMDVVYNHTSSTDVFDQLVPGYYYRTWPNGKRSDATACGNEFASDRIMGRQFMVETLKYWATEYHVDGFRFDLMAVHDIETMNLISKELRQIDSTIFLYGEGWTAGDSPLPMEKRALKNNAKKLHQVAVFSDDIRDGVKGHWSKVTEKGFVSGNPDLKEVIHFGIVASTNHPQIKYDLKRGYAQFPYSDSPTKVIGYVSCHDNNTLYDKLKIANPKATEQELTQMDRLANTIILTSQSIPFLHMGEEMKRTKMGVENSYNAPDSINKIDWNWKHQNVTLVNYYEKLIQLRKNHPAFKMPTEKMIQDHLEFLNLESPLLVGYTLKNHANGDLWKNIRVYFNGDATAVTQKIEGTWNLICNGELIDEKGIQSITSGSITIPARSAVILYQY
ncbi:type I pullulanase [Flavobacterium psychrotolerans]|uniref:Type I pullulanase n=1 Tax=Flavobacterium psychrotolerans TaxID=2169410 RepID=A0A2U1JID1_9FLAO|nr:type I pullulanase [Flavobacterium psychrotolerans]PWA04749.1 type I pullulanase [Flavobacterium psychrotolerans]